MNKVYTSACVIIPPKERWHPIQEIRQQYDRQIYRWMPHITLLYAFRPKIEYNVIETDFYKLCSSLEIFEITLRNFKFFHHKHQNYTVWLEPEPNESIISLQAKLLKIVPDCNDVNKHKNGYTPHLSVGKVKGKNNLLRIVNLLEKSWTELKFVLNRIYFISREKNKNS